MEQCRQIEVARCRSAAQCGLIEDVAACERYIVDECRHGFPANLDPSSSSVSACAKAIDDVAACAKRSGKKTAPSDCERSSLNAANADNVCELVEHPEDIPRCSFLAESSDDDDDDDNDEEEEEDVADASSDPAESDPAEEDPEDAPATAQADAATDAAP